MKLSNSLILVIVIVGVLLCISCACFVLGSLALYLMSQSGFNGDISANVLSTPTNTPHIVRPTIPATPAIPAIPGSTEMALVAPGTFTETLAAFENAIVPANDPLELVASEQF